MTDVNLYFYIENLAMTPAQVNTLVTQLKALGQRNDDGIPRFRNHWRIRPDNKAAIFEGVFDSSDLTALKARNRLAAIFSVTQVSVIYATGSTTYGPLVTFTYNDTDQLRLGVFAGVAAAYSNSQAAVRQFLSDNAAAWGEV
jgi:hypothetical protein